MKFLKKNDTFNTSENGYDVFVRFPEEYDSYKNDYPSRFIMEQGGHFSSGDAHALLNLEAYGDFVEIYQSNHTPLNIQGWHYEQNGRLQYIDGCEDTVLIAPPYKGDPCLNMLYLKSGITQTEHTHPSVRIGIVQYGSGFAHWYENGVPIKTPLNQGDVWVIEKDEKHFFTTQEQELVIMAYHPDSDFGNTDEVHPMINRTIIYGSNLDIDYEQEQEQEKPKSFVEWLAPCSHAHKTVWGVVSDVMFVDCPCCLFWRGVFAGVIVALLSIFLKGLL
jgi:hypothetical protein